jgi:hypothetical protein
MTKDLDYGGVWNCAVASQPCPSGCITVNTKGTRDFPKLLCATCFVRQSLFDSLSYLNKAIRFIRGYAPWEK